jgi:hypothetical protein
MRALPLHEIPTGSQCRYELKWRACGAWFQRMSTNWRRSRKKASRSAVIFPEMTALQAVKAKTFVVDGQIAIPVREVFSFDDLLQRILRAASRIKSSPPSAHPFDRFPPAYHADAKSRIAGHYASAGACSRPAHS